MKVLIFDSGALISLSMSNLIEELRRLKESFDGKFIITKEVKGEVIDRPLNIRRFELEAMRIQQLLDDGVLEMASSLKVSDSEITERANGFLDAANSIFETRNHPVHLIDLGEATCLALSRILDEKKIENMIAIDERTTRLLGEKPENLKKLMEHRLHMPVFEKRQNYKAFKNFKFVRSTELIYVAYKKGLIRMKSKNALNAILYSLKYHGTAISDDEIRDAERMG